MKAIIEIENRLTEKKRADRSAWSKGVSKYAEELFNELKESISYAGRAPSDRKELETFLLNGADSWEQYSYSGSALAYDGDIAERLCSPSELRKTKGGRRNPNGRETWLDVQARALSAAARCIKNAAF